MQGSGRTLNESLSVLKASGSSLRLSESDRKTSGSTASASGR